MRWDVTGFLNARSELHTSPLATAKGRQTMYSTYGLQQSHLTPEHPSLEHGVKLSVPPRFTRPESCRKHKPSVAPLSPSSGR